MLRFKQFQRLVTAAGPHNKIINSRCLNMTRCLTSIPMRQFGDIEELNQRQNQKIGRKSSVNRVSDLSSLSQSEINQIFQSKFNKNKSDLLDSWLEMDSENLIEECKKFKVKHTERHIENIQCLFEYIKKFEADILSPKGSLKQSRTNADDQEQLASNTKQTENIFQKTKSRKLKNIQTGKEEFMKDDIYKGESLEQQYTKQQYQNTGNQYSQPQTSTQAFLMSNQSRDALKAKESLNEQLAKILSKRRKTLPEIKQESQQDQNYDYSINEVAEISQEVLPVVGTFHNSYNVNHDQLINAVMKRGSLNPGQSQHMQFSIEDPKIIDKIFAMSNESIDTSFSQLVQDKRDKLVGQMKLELEDYQKIQGINKKKTLLNIQGLKQAMMTDPNLLLQEQGNKFLNFVQEYYDLFSNKNKAIIKDKLNEICLDPKIRQSIFKDLNKTLALVESIQKYGIDQQSLIRQQLAEEQLCRNESIYYDISLEKSISISKLIQFVDVDSNKINLSRVKENYYNGIRKIFTKRSVKQISFFDQLSILKALPKSEGDSISLSKSLPHMLLNEILQPANHEIWSLLDKEQIMMIVDKCCELQKCRDIQNKLRSNLLHISAAQLNIGDMHKLCEKLSENGKIGQIDSKFITQLLMRRSIKTLNYFPNANEITQYIEFYEYLYKQSPLCFVYLPMELKYTFYRLKELSKDQHLRLNDMIKFSKFMIPSLYSPTLFFDQMIEKSTTILNDENQLVSSTQSFKTDANLNETYELVDETLKRVEENTHVFDHLQLSNSRMHRMYRPIKEKTIILWWKIIDDFIEKGSQSMKEEELKIVNRIFSNPRVMTQFFIDSNHAQRILVPIMDYTLSQTREKLAELNQIQQLDESSPLVDFNEKINQLKALTNILNIQRDSQTVQKASQISVDLFSSLAQLLSKTSNFKLDEMFKVNQAVLEFLDKLKEVQTEGKKAISQRYDTELSTLKEIIQGSIEFYYDAKKPFVMKFDQQKKNVQISKKIFAEINQFMIDHNISSVINFLNHTTQENGQQLALKVCHQMNNSRGLVGNDLLSLINMIEKFGILEQVKPLMVNVAANLQTIDKPRIQNLDDQDEAFEIINKKLDQQEIEIKNKIIKKFSIIQQGESKTPAEDPLRKEEASLSPLSKIMADVIDQQTDENVLICLMILGNQKVDNYHEDFIKKIYEKYSTQQVIDEMWNNNSKFFFKFAKNWPHFLKNNAILSKLLQIKGASTLPKQQSEILGILAQQNVMHPELLETHFDTFIKMKDKESVSNYLKDYLHYCAYLGFSKFDVEKCTQVFRRIYHSPDQVPEISQILDYLVVLALSGAYYKDFDEKSMNFVEACIDYVEEQFTGVETNTVEITDQISGDVEKMKLKYFKSIPTTNKIYHKVQVPGAKQNLDLAKSYESYVKQEIDDSDEEEQASESILNTLIKKDSFDDKKSTTVVLTTGLQFKEEITFDIKSDQDERIFIEEKTLESSDVNLFGVTALDNELNADLNDNGEEIAVDKHKQEKIMEMSDQKNMRIYDRKASESLYSEELEFHQYRKKKLQDMDKKSKHLLLFSNINQLNFVDINKSDVVKAWSVLYHFRSKTTDSILYDEFESITMRNTIGKSKGHELFSNFYLKLVEKSYELGYRMQLATKCEKTGWPIDISMNFPHSNNSQQLALYFLLQEEVCLNADKQTEEPLGIQKIMIKHLKSLSNNQIVVLTENDFYMRKDNTSEFIDDLLFRKIGIQAKNMNQ